MIWLRGERGVHKVLHLLSQASRRMQGQVLAPFEAMCHGLPGLVHQGVAGHDAAVVDAVANGGPLLVCHGCRQILAYRLALRLVLPTLLYLGGQQPLGEALEQGGMGPLQAHAGEDQPYGGEEGAAGQAVDLWQRGDTQVFAQGGLQVGILPLAGDDGRHLAMAQGSTEGAVVVVVAQPAAPLQLLAILQGMTHGRGVGGWPDAIHRLRSDDR